MRRAGPHSSHLANASGPSAEPAAHSSASTPAGGSQTGADAGLGRPVPLLGRLLQAVMWELRVPRGGMALQKGQPKRAPGELPRTARIIAQSCGPTVQKKDTNVSLFTAAPLQLAPAAAPTRPRARLSVVTITGTGEPLCGCACISSFAEAAVEGPRDSSLRAAWGCGPGPAPTSAGKSAVTSRTGALTDSLGGARLLEAPDPKAWAYPLCGNM